MRRPLLKIALTLALVAVAALLAALYTSYAERAQAERAEFERYLYRAVESCQNGNMSGAYILLSRARSLAPSPADDAFVGDLIPKFRSGDCRLGHDAASDSSAIPLP